MFAGTLFAFHPLKNKMDNNNRNTPSNPNRNEPDKQNVHKNHQPEEREKLWWTEDEVARAGRIKPGRPDDTMMEDRPGFPG